MSQQNRKRQHLEKQEQEGQQKGSISEVNKEWAFNCEDNANELREPELKMATFEAKNGVLSASLAKVKKENETLGEKLRKAEQKAQMVKNEMEEFIITSRQKDEELANLIAKLKEQQQKEEKTISSSNTDLELNLELKITQNSLDCHRVPLPLELNCQIFECLMFESQRKFIGGLGRGIYGIFRQKVLKKSKRLRNPEQNGWEVSTTGAIISFNGLCASDNSGFRQTVYAKKGFPSDGELSRPDNFPGTILYYFEVTQVSDSAQRWNDFRLGVGLSDGNNSDSDGFFIYCNQDPKLDSVCGCGILLNPENKSTIFFTSNGTFQFKHGPFNLSMESFFPSICMTKVSVEANFGMDPAKPFCYDIEKCPGFYDD